MTENINTKQWYITISGHYL